MLILSLLDISVIISDLSLILSLCQVARRCNDQWTRTTKPQPLYVQTLPWTYESRPVFKGRQFDGSEFHNRHKILHFYHVEFSLVDELERLSFGLRSENNSRIPIKSSPDS